MSRNCSPATRSLQIVSGECSRACTWFPPEAHGGLSQPVNAAVERVYADPSGRMLNGLPQQFDVIVATHGSTPLEQRQPKVMWRGRASDEPRDAVRCTAAELALS